MRILALLAVLATFLPSLPADAWSSAGHEVIAAIAWRELPTKTKSKAFDILKAHPDFEKWKASFQPDSGNVDLAAFVFMRASTWPDTIRRRGNDYDHPEWHYVDWALRPPAFALSPEPNPTNNILFGIAQSGKVVSDPTAAPETRAAHLSWLLHLCGDIAQPMHCASFFDDTSINGDKGGNDCYVKPASRGIRLHSFWDGLLGTSGRAQQHMNEAVRISTEHSRRSLRELKKHKTPKDWSLEGRTLAIEKVYLRGELHRAATADTAPPLPDGYTIEAKTLAETQAAKAGYRLADEIKRLTRK
jgi:hypothetical protein